MVRHRRPSVVTLRTRDVRGDRNLMVVKGQDTGSALWPSTKPNGSPTATLDRSDKANLWLIDPQMKRRAACRKKAPGPTSSCAATVWAAAAGADSARILQDAGRRAGREDLGACKRAARQAICHPRTPLPARRSHPVRRFPGRLLQALAAGRDRRPRPSSSSSAACTSWPRAPTFSGSRTSR